MEAEVVWLNVFGQPKDEFTIQPENNFIDDHSEFAPPALKLDSAMKKLVEQRYLYAQVENAFYKVKKDSIVHSLKDLRFFGTPDKIYKLDDFMRFQTMEDIFREIIPEVVLKARDDKFAISIANLISGERFFTQPLILIDGIPVRDPNNVMKYDPLKVKTISIIARRYFYGGLESEGIISIETFNGEAESVVKDDLLNIPYVQPARGKRYYSPDYDGKKNLLRIPDYRTQLYWNPNIEIPVTGSDAIEFYTSDIPGQYFIEVSGTSTTGEYIHWTKTFFVK
jgi:hypothetical protein